MHSNDNRQPSLEAALVNLDIINRHVVVLTRLGQTREATGAENAWLDAAIRAAMMPAETREAAAFKIKVLTANMNGWGAQASKANGLLGAAALVMGALAAETYEWSLNPEDADAGDAGQQAAIVADIVVTGALAAYRANARPRRLGPAIERYQAIVAEIDAMLARQKGDRLLADALNRSREALLDVFAISTRNVAELEQKQRAYLDFRDLPGRAQWLCAHGVSVAFNIDYSHLELPVVEVERLRARLPKPWTSSDCPSDEEWTRRNQVQ